MISKSNSKSIYIHVSNFSSSSIDEKVTESKNSIHEVVSVLSLILTKKERTDQWTDGQCMDRPCHNDTRRHLKIEFGIDKENRATCISSHLEMKEIKSLLYELMT